MNPKNVECVTTFVIAGCENEDELQNAHQYIHSRLTTAARIGEQQIELETMRGNVEQACREVQKRGAELAEQEQEIVAKDELIEKLQARICGLLTVLLFLGLIVVIVGGFAWHR